MDSTALKKKSPQTPEEALTLLLALAAGLLLGFAASPLLLGLAWGLVLACGRVQGWLQ